MALLAGMARIVAALIGYGLMGAATLATDADSHPQALAITDPAVLRALDLEDGLAGTALREGFGLRRVLAPMADSHAPLMNDELFRLPSMTGVRAALDRAFAHYVEQARADRPGLTIGVGGGHDLQLFDRAVLASNHARFVLAGLVNRMDRAFVSPAACGEIRLIYRLTRIDDASGRPPERLPMTLNVVLDGAAAHANAAPDCAGLASRWLAIADQAGRGPALLSKLASRDGPLVLVAPANLNRIELNLQIGHVAGTASRDFRADYLMKVFRFDAARRAFVESPLENQIDRARLLADAGLARDFREWLLRPDHLAAFDRGTVLIPLRFLATSALAATPAGFGRSGRQPAFGLVAPAGDGGAAVFKPADVTAALEEAARQGIVLGNIRSVAGFERRLNDITCAGCHQTRGIGGFHFPGVDWMRAAPSNETVVPASPHFVGDQVRRRDILAAFGAGRPPDFSRGFSSRPQLRGNRELAGTSYSDGWGAHCYILHPGNDNDPSFRSWTCAQGLACQAVGRVRLDRERFGKERMGMCFVSSE